MTHYFVLPAAFHNDVREWTQSKDGWAINTEGGLFSGTPSVLVIIENEDVALEFKLTFADHLMESGNIEEI